MPIVLDGDARDYLRMRRAQSAMSSAGPLDPEALRREERILRGRYGHGPEMRRETERPARGGVPRHFVLEPTAAPRGTLVYLHGGGWVMGEPEDYLAVCRALAAESGWRVVVADYRKAPEHPFPAAFEDALAVVLEVLRDSGGRPVAVAGDSAGGNLAAAVSAELGGGDSGPLAAQVLITPVLDSDLGTASYLDPDRQLSLTREAMRWFWDCYAPEQARDDVRLAPLRRTGFESLPPTVFVSVRSDVLWSEGEQYLARLRRSGVPVRHREYPGQMHGFFQLYNVMASSQDAVAWIARELDEIVGERADDTTERGTPE